VQADGADRRNILPGRRRGLGDRRKQQRHDAPLSVPRPCWVFDQFAGRAAALTVQEVSGRFVA